MGGGRPLNVRGRGLALRAAWSRKQGGKLPHVSAPPSDLFFQLTPELVLEAVEAAGLACRNLCYPLNSFENRVYEVELEEPLENGERRLVAKFYRPGRWSEAQILEEHAFLTACDRNEIPVAPAREFPGGGTLRVIDGIPYALFDRKAGRAPDELDEAAAERLGMLVGRVHSVGARLAHEDRVRHRLTLDADSYVRGELDWLEDGDWVPDALWPRYRAAATAIADLDDRYAEGKRRRFFSTATSISATCCCGTASCDCSISTTRSSARRCKISGSRSPAATPGASSCGND